MSYRVNGEKCSDDAGKQY